jgi:putative hydroxymethylpyrimidine transport system substrate-binding protein
MANEIEADKIARFLAATEKATQYMVNHPEESWKIFSGTAKELQDELNKRAWVDTLARFALRPSAFDFIRYRRFEEFLHEAGLVDGLVSVDQLAIDVSAQ